MQKPPRTEIEEAKKEIKNLMMSYGKYLTSKDLLNILSSCQTKSLQSAVNQILAKRRKGKGRLERWLETYMINYYIENNRFPKADNVRELMIEYFDIPFKLKRNHYGKEVKVFPERINKLILRVRKRVHRKVQSGKLKHKNEAIGTLRDVIVMFENGEIDVQVVMAFWDNEKVWLNKEEQEVIKNEFIRAGLHPLFFEAR